MSRVAVVQAAPIVFDRDRTLELIADWTARAADEGASLVLFPEAFVSGYPKGLDFGARFGLRTPAGRDDYLRYWNSAVDVPGPAVDQIGAAAKRHQIHLVIGVIERDGGTLYCTVLFFDPGGQLMGKHRKLMPTAAERLVWGFGDGSTMPVFDTPLGRLGAVICWENYMPAMRLHMYAKGIQIYCAPTADERETWAASMRATWRAASTTSTWWAITRAQTSSVWWSTSGRRRSSSRPAHRRRAATGRTSHRSEPRRAAQPWRGSGGIAGSRSTPRPSAIRLM